MTRIAISPRFAIRIFLNIARTVERSHFSAFSSCADSEEPLAVLDRLAVLDVDVHDFAVVLGIDLVHQLHRFDDAEHVAFFYGRSNLDERGRAGFGRTIERAADRQRPDGDLASSAT